MNLIIIFLTMGVVTHTDPNYDSAQKSFGISPGPLERLAFVDQTLPNKVNGIMQMVFAVSNPCRRQPCLMKTVRRGNDISRVCMLKPD